MIIYMATNMINNKLYIGQTIRSLEQRKCEHIYDALNKRNTMYFGRAIRKYGPENFTWDILHECNNIDFLNRLEIFYIGYYNTFGNDNGYNLTLGGWNSLKSTETRNKISIGNKGKHHSIKSRIKMSEAAKGKKHSEESKLKMSESHKGKKLSPEHKRKIGESGKGRRHLEEAKRKIGEANRGKNSYGATSIIIDGEYFDTRDEASIYVGVAPSTIRLRILHKTKWPEYSYA